MCREAAIKRSECLRQLDDNVYVGEAMVAWSFYHTFVDLAEDVGVRLADFAFGKAFAPQPEGQILGLTYSLPLWTVHLEEKKLLPILVLLHQVVDCDEVPNSTLQTINGKLTHYFMLGGRYIQ